MGNKIIEQKNTSPIDQSSEEPEMLLMEHFNHFFPFFPRFLDIDSHVSEANPCSTSEEFTA